MNRDIANANIVIIEDAAVSKNHLMHKAVSLLKKELLKRNIQTVILDSHADGKIFLGAEMDIDTILIATDMKMQQEQNSSAARLLEIARRCHSKVPLFLLADHENCAAELSIELLRNADEYIWIFEESIDFIAGRLESAISRYRSDLLPPLMQAIWDYNEKFHEYSYAAPGHQGGRGFAKTPVGRKFYDFFGANLLRTDTGIERTSIGSLPDHTGSFGESEKFAAKVFGSHITFSTIVGTSGSNRTVMQAVLTPGDGAICDRNCHKSIEQGLILSGAVPVYLLPSRNRYGIIGPVPPPEFSPEMLSRKFKHAPAPVTGDIRSYAVLTNCTYDGICYNAAKVEAMLAPSVDRVHFDEAWYAYARFHPIYAGHFAMRGDPAKHQGGLTIFATHSTHKLLTALSQASMIHLRNGKKAIPFERLSQAAMMHSSTSPLYAICASNDVAVKTMADHGRELLQEMIAEAVDFRQVIASMYRDFRRKGEWFFQIWNAPEITDRTARKSYFFADAPKQLLVNEQSVWRLKPGELWHGFEHLPEENYAMLDPLKVSILTPGIATDGSKLDSGVPAALVNAFLATVGIVPTRSTDFQLMFLFGPGITKGKWVTLLNTLLKFKELYDSNAPVREVLPEAAAFYPKLGLHELGDKMFDHLRRYRPGEKLNRAFATLPKAAMTPREAFMQMVRGDVEFLPVEKAVNRIAGCAIIPYPPGIPLVMSGERFGEKDCPRLAYLQTLARWDREFPGFSHITEGCKYIDGENHIMCLR